MRIKYFSKLAVVASLSVAAYSYSSGQTIKPSADAMATVNSIQNPVDYSTGTVSTQIPLYSVQSGDIQVPVSLVYGSNGRKVDDQCSSVGLGWRLVAGGKVTRLVRGEADEPGAQWYRISADLNSIASGFYGGSGNYLTQSPYYNKVNFDTDLYYFEIPGRSGMFVLDGTGVGRTIPYQNIDIKYQTTIFGGQTYPYFTIRDENGNEYVFGHDGGSRENTHMTYNNTSRPAGSNNNDESLPYSKDYLMTWHLNKITDYKGNIVDFTYRVGESVTSVNYHYTYYVYPTRMGHLDREDEFESKVTTRTSTSLLSKISWNGGELVFVKTSGKNRLERIEYKTTENIKTTKFTYRDYPASSSPNKQTEFMLLKSIDETNFISGTIGSKIASFEYYNEDSAPLTDNPQMDFDSWGYYNGRRNTTYRTKTSDFTGYAASRDPNPTTTLYHMLKKAAYPTGGTVEYVYELNKNSGSVNVGGLRIKEIKRQADAFSPVLTTRYEYYLPGNGGYSSYSSGVEREIPKYKYIQNIGPNDDIYVITSTPMNDMTDVGGKYILYSHVTEIQPNGSKTMYTYTTDNSGGRYKDSVCTLYTCDPNGAGFTVTRINATNPTTETGQPYPKTPRFWRRGLLTSVTNYDTNGNTVSYEQYGYRFGDANGEPKTIIKGYYPFSVRNKDKDDRVFQRRYFSIHEWRSEAVYMDTVVRHSTAYNPRSETVYTYNTDYMVPTEVKTTDAEGNVTRAVTRYNFDFPTYYQLSAFNDNKMAVPIEQTTYYNGQVTGSQFTEYGNFKVDAANKLLPYKTYDLLIAQHGNGFTPTQMQNNAITMDGNYKHVSTVESYGAAGQPLVTTTPTGKINSTVYGHDNTLPVASVSGARSVPLVYIENPINHTLQSYSLSGITRTETFTIPYRQSIYIQVRYPENLYQLIVGGLQRPYHLLVYNAADNTVYYSYDGMNEDNTPSFEIPAGDYYIQFFCNDGYGVEGVFFYLNYKNKVHSYTRRNQVFHTSFEDVAGSTGSGYAKTGDKVFSGNFAIDMNDFAPGTYVITYWRINANSGAMSMITENITVPAATGTQGTGVVKTIPATAGYYIDEVRVLPAEARITTYTYRPGVGMTSETDHNGISTHYRYDTRGRLYRVLNNDKAVLKQYEYNVLGDN